MVGPGWSADPPPIRRACLAVCATRLPTCPRRLPGHGLWPASTGRAREPMARPSSWRPPAAAADALAMRADALGASTGSAAASVARASARLRPSSSVSRPAAALERTWTPRHRGRAPARGPESARRGHRRGRGATAELDGQAGALTGPTTPAPSAPTAPAGFASTPGMGSGLGRRRSADEPAARAPGGMPVRLGACRCRWRCRGSQRPPYPRMDPDSTFGDGVAVRLPDGSTALAPNKVAADAVRHALTQLGVPYQWGGTAPGVGLDCSGLTQWAYRKGTYTFRGWPRSRTSAPRSTPGRCASKDLAVWDGHVAMIVGKGDDGRRGRHPGAAVAGANHQRRAGISWLLPAHRLTGSRCATVRHAAVCGCPRRVRPCVLRSRCRCCPAAPTWSPERCCGCAGDAVDLRRDGAPVRRHDVPGAGHAGRGGPGRRGAGRAAGSGPDRRTAMPKRSSTAVGRWCRCAWRSPSH